MSKDTPSNARAKAVAIVQRVVADAHRTLSPEQLDRIIDAVAYDLETDQPASEAARLATRIIAMAEPPDSIAPAAKVVKI